MLSAETRQILNDPELVRIRDAHLQRLQALFAGQDTENDVFMLNGVTAPSHSASGSYAVVAASCSHVKSTAI